MLRGKETLEHLLGGEFKEKLLQPLPNYFLYNFYPMALILLNPHFYYEWFHLLNLLFSVFGFVAVYFLTFRITKSTNLSLFSMAALVFFPRFFGQLGFNPIDMPFMVFYLWSLLAILRYSEKDANHWSVLVMGVLFGITQGLRQLGFTIYILMVVADLYDAYFDKGLNLKCLKMLIREKYLKYIYVFVVANFFMLITWPNFAINFFKSYIWYLFIGSNFYLWDFGLLFFGNFLENYQRPWFYLPFLQLITYPIYITALFWLILKFFRRHIRNKTYFLLTAALVLNYILYLILDPVLYDGIRHFLFMIPIIVILATANLQTLYRTITSQHAKKLLYLAVFIGIVPSAVFTIREFPYQYAYFNPIAYTFGDPYRLFESDYANTKYRQAAEWLRDEYLKDESVYSHSNPEKMLKVYACDNAYALDYFSHKKFLSVIDKDEADLIVCDYRNLKQSGYKGEVIKEFYIGDSTVLYIMKL